MESTLSPSSLLTLSKTLKFTRSHLHYRFLSPTNPSPLSRPLTTLVLARRLRSAIDDSKSAPFGYLRSVFAVVPLVRCVPSSAACFASGGGSGGGGIGGGGGDDDGSDGGNSKVGGVSGTADDVSALSPDVIILDVGGMTCGGCAASVKRILENQPQVSSASVNLATETAIVWPATEVKVVPNWQQDIGEKLAIQLTSCGFQSSLRGQGDMEGNVPL